MQGSLYDFIDGEKFPNVKTIDLSNVTASNITSMQETFIGLGKLTSINFGDNFDTSGVGNMSEMFSSCKELTSLDLSKFVITAETNVSNMFRYCIKLTSLTVGENFTQGISQNMSLSNIGYTYDENEYRYVPSGERYGWYKDLQTKTIISGEGDNAVIDAEYINSTGTTTFYRSDYTPPTGGDEGGTGEGGNTSNNPTDGSTQIEYTHVLNPTYTVQIPATVTLNKSENVTAQIGVTSCSDLEVNQRINIKLTDATNKNAISDSEFNVVLSDTDAKASYQVKKGNTALKLNDTAYTFTFNGENAPTVDSPNLENLTFTPPQGATKAGKYTDTLTFTVSLDTP